MFLLLSFAEIQHFLAIIFSSFSSILYLKALVLLQLSFWLKSVKNSVSHSLKLNRELLKCLHALIHLYVAADDFQGLISASNDKYNTQLKIII